jgi:O-antigen/teichoic acid export membrane protein
MKEIGKQTLAYTLTFIFIRLQGFLLLPFVTRHVPKAELSIFDTLVGYGTVIGMFTVLGMDGALATLYRNPEYERERRSMAWTAVLLVALASLAGTLGFVAFQGVIERDVFRGRWELGLEVSLAAAAVIAGSLQHILANILRQEFQIKQFNISVIGGGLLQFGCTLLVVIGLGWQVKGMLFTLLLTGLLKMGLMLWWTRKYLDFRFSGRLAKRLLTLGLPLLPVSLCGWFISMLHPTLFQIWRTPEEATDYGMANKFAMLATVVTSAFQTAWWPYAMSKAREEGAAKHFQQVCRVAVVMGVLLAVAVGAVTPVIMWLVLAPEYHQSFRTSSLQVMSAVVNTYYYFPLVSLLLAMKIKLEVFGYMTGMAVTVLLSLLLVPPYGPAGAVMATVLGFIALSAVVGRLGRKVHDFGFPLGRIELFFVLSAAALGLWLVVPVETVWGVLLVAPATAVLALAAAVVTGVLRKQDAVYGWQWLRGFVLRKLRRGRPQQA